jgi:hypothetical protein
VAVSGGIVEKFRDGGCVITCKAAGAITAGNVVDLTGNNGPEVQQAGANSVACKGVALQTCTTAGELIGVAFNFSQVYKLIASGAVNAGDYVKSGATGKVVSVAADGDPRLVMGVALEDAVDLAEVMVGLI